MTDNELKERAEVDIMYLKEMNTNLNKGDIGMVRTLISDWIAELEELL